MIDQIDRSCDCPEGANVGSVRRNGRSDFVSSSCVCVFETPELLTTGAPLTHCVERCR
jgi:hypothetical protein